MDFLGDIWIHHFFLFCRFVLVAATMCFAVVVFVYVQERRQRKKIENENARIVQVRALSPPVPSYEERMGVQYGQHKKPQSSELQGELR